MPLSSFFDDATIIPDTDTIFLSFDHKRRPFKVKRHDRPAQSLFRVGLDRLVSVLFRGIRLLEVLGNEVMDLLAVKEDVE